MHFLSMIPANIRLGEDVLKTSWRRLEYVFSVTFFCLPRRLEDVLEDEKCYAEDVLKTSWRRLGKQEMFAGIALLFLARKANSELVTHLKWCFFSENSLQFTVINNFDKKLHFQICYAVLNLSWVFFQFTFIIDLFSSLNIFKY